MSTATSVTGPCNDQEMQSPNNKTIALPITEKQMLVKEPGHFIRCLQRMKQQNTGVMFYNYDQSFKILLRNDPDCPDGTLGGELCIVYMVDDDPKDEIVQKSIKLEPDGYVDEDGVFVLDSFSFGCDDISAALDAAARLNEVYVMSICPCQNYFIKDGGTMCLFCSLTSSKHDLHPRFCCVCQEASAQMHMLVQPCCSQHIHTSCLATWHHTSGKAQCPMCRSELQ